MGMIETFRSVVQFRQFESDPVKRRLASAASVEDLRRIAKRRLPAGVFDYIDGAAEDELSMGRNASRYSAIEYVPRVLRDVSTIDTTTTILGRSRPSPIVLAPTGFTRIADSQGELAVARAAAAVGLPYTLSTVGTRSIEEVSAVSNGPLWFQVYTWKDRALVQSMVERAAAAGFEALMLTVDTAVLGRRERDVRRGMTLPPKIGPSTIVDGILHPAWTWDFLNADPITFANVVGHGDADGTTAVTLSQFTAEQFDAALSWQDVEWLRSIWDGPILIKGIQSVADAKLAVESGVEGIVLSNHGGRQLDSAPAIIDLVAPVVDAVGGQLQVLCDGGIRRGSDVLKAVALGADAVMIGRPYLYGLGAAGEQGVAHVLDFLQAGLERDMALIGVASLDEVDDTYLRWIA